MRRWLIVFTACAFCSLAQAAPLGTAFSYQGVLNDAGVPANGLYDLEVCLYAVPAGGSAITCNGVFDDQPVSNGLFTLSLDFGAAPFRGEARFLELRVAPGAGGTPTPLAPRTSVQAVPYALHSPSFDTAADALFTTIRSLPAGLNLGGPTALAVGPSGTPVVGVGENVSGDTRLSWYLCDDAPCSSGRLAPFTTLRSGTFSSRFSVAVGTDGLAVAAYAAAGGLSAPGDLRVASCNSAACNAPSVPDPIDRNASLSGIDVTMTADNRPVVGYMQTNGQVSIAICRDPRCSASVSRRLFDTGDTNQGRFHTAVALARGDHPRVAFMSYPNGNMLALCADAECRSVSIVALPNIQGGTPMGIAMALSSDDTATVAQSSSALPSSIAYPSIGIYQCPNPACTGSITSHQFSVPNATGFVAPGAGLPALVIGADSVPLAAFGSGDNGGMHVLHGRPREFTNGAASVTMLDAQSQPYSMVAMALGPQGRPVLAYLGPEGVRVASCNTRTCQ